MVQGVGPGPGGVDTQPRQPPPLAGVQPPVLPLSPRVAAGNHSARGTLFCDLLPSFTEAKPASRIKYLTDVCLRDGYIFTMWLHHNECFNLLLSLFSSILL